MPLARARSQHRFLPYDGQPFHNPVREGWPTIRELVADGTASTQILQNNCNGGSANCVPFSRGLMRQLTFIKKGRVEWQEGPEPRLTGPLQAMVRTFVAARCDGDCVPLFRTLPSHERRDGPAPSRSPGGRCSRPKAASGAVCVWPRMHRDGAGGWGRRAYGWRWRSSDCAVGDLMWEVLSLRKRPDRQVQAERNHAL